MALIAKGNKITMDVNDYGIQLPFDVTGAVFEPFDKMRFELKKSKDSDVLFSRDYLNELDSTSKFRFFLELTQEESSQITQGNYLYFVKYLRNDIILDTIASDDFKVRNGNR